MSFQKNRAWARNHGKKTYHRYTFWEVKISTYTSPQRTFATTQQKLIKNNILIKLPIRILPVSVWCCKVCLSCFVNSCKPYFSARYHMPSWANGFTLVFQLHRGCKNSSHSQRVPWIWTHFHSPIVLQAKIIASKLSTTRCLLQRTSAGFSNLKVIWYSIWYSMKSLCWQSIHFLCLVSCHVWS